MEIANNDPAARVCFFFKEYDSSFSVRKTILDNNNGIWMHRACEYTSPCGGRLKVTYCKPEDWADMSGWQFTHVFYVRQDFAREYTDVLNFLKSRIRSAKYKGEAPMGMYNEWFAEINVSY